MALFLWLLSAHSGVESVDRLGFRKYRQFIIGDADACQFDRVLCDSDLNDDSASELGNLLQCLRSRLVHSSSGRSHKIWQNPEKQINLVRNTIIAIRALDKSRNGCSGRALKSSWKGQETNTNISSSAAARSARRQ